MRPLTRHTALALFAAVTTAPLAAQPSFARLDSAGPLPPPLARPVTLTVDRVPLGSAVAALAQAAGLAYVADPALAALARPVTLRVQQVPVATALLRALAGNGVVALASSAGQLVLVADTAAAPGARPGDAAATDARAAARRTQATVRGQVRDAESGLPVVGAQVRLVGATTAGTVPIPAEARTGDDGRFTLRVAADGPTRRLVRVAALGYQPRLVPLPAPDAAGAIPPLAVALAATPVPLAAVVVTAGTFGLVQRTPAAPLTLTRTQLTTTPQIGEDVYRAVLRLPGLAADDFAAGFSVRGGGYDQLYTTLDGLELVEPFHIKDIGGAISSLDAQAVGAASLTAGGPTADVGDRLTGTFALRSVEPRTDRTRTQVGLSVMNARALAEGGLPRALGGGERGGWLVSARRGYLDLAFRLAGVDTIVRPRYGDVFAKVYRDLPAAWPVRGRVTVHALHADDRLRYEDDDGSVLRSHYTSGNVWLTWAGAVGGPPGATAPGEDPGRWPAAPLDAPGADAPDVSRPSAPAAASTSAEARLGQRTVLTASALGWRRAGDIVSQGAPYAAVNDRRRFGALGVRQDWTWTLGPRALLRWGADVRQEHASYDYRRTYAPEYAPDSSWRGHFLAVTAEPAGTRVGLYAAARLRPLPALVTELGVRRDRASAVAAAGGSVPVLPRFNTAWTPRPGTTVRGAWGLTSQSQQLYQLQAADGVSRFWPAERAEHREVGLDQRLPSGLTSRVELYDRRLRDLRPRFVTTDGTNLAAFPELQWDRLLVRPTSGRARGVELLVARPAGRRTDWTASYALARAEERVGGALAPLPMDQRHAARVDWALHPARAGASGPPWRLSVAWQWHSGWPYTPNDVRVSEVVDTPESFGYAVTAGPGPYASARLPAYQRLDLRWTRTLSTRRGRGLVFAELFNALGADNVRGYRLRTRVDPGTGPGTRRVLLDRSPGFFLPRFPAGGVSWEF